MELYHGSKISGLNELSPKDPGRGASFAYATTEPCFAAILFHRPGGGFVRMWEKNEHNQLYLIERVENIFENLYSGVQGSIYEVNSDSFCVSNPAPREEWVSNETVDILKETFIDDLWEYICNLERKGVLELYRHKNRNNHSDGTDEAIIKTGVRRIKKYGGKAIEEIKLYHPHLLTEILRRCNT